MDRNQKLLETLNKVKVATEVKRSQVRPLPQETDTRKTMQVKRLGGRKWWLVGAGAGTILFSFIGVMMMGESRNMAVGAVAVLGLVAGSVAIYFGWRKQDEGIVFIKDGTAAKRIVANSLNIYSDRLEYEELPAELLMGQPRRCRNDGKYYYLNIWGEAWKGEVEALVKFVLPDTQYRDPREFANNINIPAHRRLAQKRAGLLEKLTPWALVAGIGIVAILLIIV